MPPTSVLTREAIFAIARGLPPGPRAFAELERRLRDGDAPLEEIAALIKRDGTLTAHLIRMSNSSVYGGAQRIGGVEEAVARIGYREIYRLVGFLAGAQLAERSLQHYGIDAELLRRNLLQSAFMAERIAEAAGLDGRTAYTAGLMRLLGLLVLDRVADHYAPLEPYHPVRDPDFTSWEGRWFGLGSNEIAALVLEEWSFPAAIVEAVRGQYLPRSDDGENRLALVLSLAGELVSRAGGGLLGEAKHWQNAAAKAAALGLDPESLPALMARGREACTAFERHLNGLGDDDASPAPLPVPAPAGDTSKAANPCNFGASPRVLEAEHERPVPTQPAGEMTPVDFTTFMRNYQDMVYTTAVRLLGNEAQAEDISQEVFLKAYQRFDDLATSPTAGGWLKTVTTNLSINHLQRYRKRWRFFSELVRQDDEGDEGEPVEFAAPDSDFLGTLNQGDRRAWVERALEKLPTHQRVPLVLYHFEDLPYDEIARRLGVSLAKVKTDILRGRAALAQILARSGTAHEALQPEF